MVPVTKRFADFAETPKILDGDKVRIEAVLNKELVILNFAVKESRYNKNESGKYLTLQVSVDNEKRVIFTGSEVLIGQLIQYAEQIPFVATIKKVDKFYTLT